MAAPTPYALAYDFTAFQVANPTSPLPADKHEIEYNAIALTTGEIITNLGLIQRSDGALANGIVTTDSLAPGILAILGAGSGDIATVADIEDEIVIAAGIAANVTTVAGLDTEIAALGPISTAISTVAGIAADVSAVENIAASVQTVAGIAAHVAATGAISADVTTVAGIAANVTTVAGIASSVAALGPISADISTVAAVDDEIVAIAAISSSVISLGSIPADVTTVAGIASDVTSVAGNEANINIVAGLDTEIATIIGISTAINTVASIDTSVTTVAGIDTEITTLSTVASDIPVVSAISSQVQTVAAIDDDVQAVANISSQITTLAAITSDITDAANNIPKANRTATINPTVNDDVGDGYSEGSIWVNTTTNEVFFCGDSAAGAAVWNTTTAGGSSLATLTDVTLTSVATGDMLRYNGSLWVNRTAAQTRSDLGLVIGTNVQAYDAELAAIAGLTSAADRLPYFTGSGTASLATFTSAARDLLDDADASTMRTTLGLGVGNSPTFETISLNASTGLMTFDADGAFTGILNMNALSGNRTWSLPNASGTFTLATSTSLVNLNTVGTITTGVWEATDVGVAHGGTGASDASGARTNLGLVIGTNVQAYDAELAAIAGLTSAADRLPYFTGSGTASLATFTAGGRALVNSAGTANTFPYFSASNTVTLGSITTAGRNLIDDADTTAQRATLGLVIGTNVQAYDAELAALAGLTSAANKVPYFTGSGTAGLLDFIDEDNMASNSATAVPSQQSVKAYVDANAGASRWVLLSTATASASASVSFNNTYITTTYNKYVITIEDLIPASDGEDLWLRTDTNNGASFETSGYSYKVHSVDTATPDAYVSDSDNRINVTSNTAGYGIGNATGEGCYLTIFMFRPMDANDITKFVWQGVYSNVDSDTVLVSGAGARDTAEATDAIQFLMSTGNITSGTFKIYGVDET